MKDLQDTIVNLVSNIDGIFGVCVRDISTGVEIGIRMDDMLPMASTCKVPILVEAYNQVDLGMLDIYKRMPFTEDDQCLGSGLFRSFHPGFEPTIFDCLLMMIVVSDNAATDIVSSLIGLQNVNVRMRGLGLNNIRLDRPIRTLIGDILVAADDRYEGISPKNWDEYLVRHPDLKEIDKDLNIGREAVNQAAADMDVASPRDLARLCAMIAEHKAASEGSCLEMLSILDKQLLNGRIPRDLPVRTRFPHKTGTLGSGAVVNDIGILFNEEVPLASIAILSRDLRNPVYETCNTMAAIGRALYEYYF